MDDPVHVLVMVWIYYGIYGCCGFAATCFFRTFLVIPILKHAGVEHQVNPWMDAAKWGFFSIWEYCIAVAFLVGYKTVFKAVFFLLRVDLAKNEFFQGKKEQHFLSHNPKTLLAWWVSESFSKYYPASKTPA